MRLPTIATPGTCVIFKAIKHCLAAPLLNADSSANCQQIAGNCQLITGAS